MNRRWVIIALCVVLIGLSAPVAAAEKGIRISSVGVMPFGTFTVEDLFIDMTLVVTNGLKKHDFSVISQDTLEDFLARRRIRRADFLDRPAIRAMGATLSIEALIIGSVDLIAGGENPQVSINASMIDCVDAKVIWANAVSKTGADFASFLGLGKITSLDELVEVVVEELLKGLPDKIALDDSSISPFEVVRAGFSPGVLRGGEKTNLSLEIEEIIGKVSDVKAFILETEIELETNDGRFYNGVVTAPALEGTYPLKVYVTDRWNRLFSVDAMAKLTVHNSPPEISLYLRRELISPNNDGINDYTLFIPERMKSAALKSWMVEISNEDGQVVRAEEGMGSLPDGFVWHGEGDTHKVVKDGAYFCRLTAQDEAGNTSHSEIEKVIVDTTAPEVTIVVEVENEDGMTLALNSRDISQIDYWELIIHDETGSESGRFEGKGDLPETLTIGLKKKINTA